MFGKIKNIIWFIKWVKKKVEKKQIQEKEKSKQLIEKLPEKKCWPDFKLEEIVTFWFLFRTWLYILFLIYLWYIASNSIDLIYSIFTAFIISIALENTISFFSKYIYRSVSIVISYLILIFFLILWFFILIPFILSHVGQIIEILINKISIIQNEIASTSLIDFVNSLHIYPYIKDKIIVYLNNPDIASTLKDFIMTNISNILNTFWDYMKIISTYAVSAISSAFSTITQIVIVFTLAIFFSFEKDKVVYTIAQLSTKPKITAKKISKLYYQLWEWLKWQILLWVFIWLSVFFWLLTLNIFGINLENKWTLALIAGLMEFIPYLGPILGSLPSLLVASLSYGFSWFLIVWILFIIIQQIEWLIVPIIMNKALWVSPLLIMIMMLVWMKVMGLVGIILAIPFAVIISLLFEDELQKEK